MLETTSAASRTDVLPGPTSTDAGSFCPASRHVMAGPAGHGGVTVTATPLGAVANGVPGPELLALADLWVTGAAEQSLGGAVVAWREGGSVWLRLSAQGLRIVLEERDEVAELAALPPAADAGTGRFVWTVVDPHIGEVAARAFGDGRDDDIVGFRGALALTRQLGRPLLLQLGTGSVIATRPAPRGRVEIGGAVGPVRPSTGGSHAGPRIRG